MIYHSVDDGLLYQKKPIYKKTSNYPAKGWTESKASYLREAKMWAMCVHRNREYMKRRYTWVVHLNLNDASFPVNEIGPMWQRAVRKLKRVGIVALWVREPNRLNKLHYHILIKNRIEIADLRQAFEYAMPPRTEVRWRKRVEPIRNHIRLPYYMFKAKIKGDDKKGVFHKDLYRSKRLLFKPGMPFDKVGSIGDFWEPGKSQKILWEEIKAIEKQIGEASDNPNRERLVEYLYEYLGKCVNLVKIQRSLRYFDQSTELQKWIEQKVADEWSEDDWNVDLASETPG